MFSKKSICVIGASGLVGSNIVKEALKKEYIVNGTIREKNSSRKESYLQKLYNSENLNIYNSNMSDKETLKSAIEGTVDKSKKIQKKDIAKESDIKNVIICSSTSSTNPIPPVKVKNEVDHWSDEKLQCAEKKYTSAAKTFMEKAAIKFCNENSIRLSIILPTGLYGEGLLPDHMKHSPFSWLKVLIETGKPIFVSI